MLFGLVAFLNSARKRYNVHIVFGNANNVVEDKIYFQTIQNNGLIIACLSHFFQFFGAANKRKAVALIIQNIGRYVRSNYFIIPCLSGLVVLTLPKDANPFILIVS